MPDCMVCGQQAPTFNRFSNWCWVECRRCGDFTTDHTFAKMAAREGFLDADTRRILSGIIRQATDRHGKLVAKIRWEGDNNYETLIRSSEHPRTALEQAEVALVALADASKHLGARVKIENSEPWIARCFLSTSGEWGQLVEGLINVDWIRQGQNGSFILTAAGWAVAEKARRRVRVPDKAFVAMWFTPFMSEALAGGIAPALRECGFSPPFVVLESKTDNKIDDEIIAMIRRSSLAVIDLTGARPSVYYEAGLAHGLGMKVIFTCASAIAHWKLNWNPLTAEQPTIEAFASWDQAPAFDIRQYPVIDWSDPQDLKEKLIARIRARGWDANGRGE